MKAVHERVIFCRGTTELKALIKVIAAVNEAPGMVIGHGTDVQKVIDMEDNPKMTFFIKVYGDELSFQVLDRLLGFAP
jgi:hypothetical protein